MLAVLLLAMGAVGQVSRDRPRRKGEVIRRIQEEMWPVCVCVCVYCIYICKSMPFIARETPGKLIAEFLSTMCDIHVHNMLLCHVFTPDTPQMTC